ncbi:Gfo/Idh/MocA family oxidoreductase [Rhizobiales bacterium]|uniref:Gfo/Idh/MocA family protein n=1 Tax=Hongsoonwoonella zoysiae TaxID=2821844 RepID=UPI001560A984|nr:Gfo/Idh/MocA family oxidoreductase [Hongsoonwoonella zoysiae]NRG19618.1 Gfo/Idh/MocA family oxidoreductase [Hongsoonwoonella zoysiae]
MKSIGVGLIGSGFMGKCHAIAWSGVKPVFGDVPAPRLVQLADVNADLARQKAEEFGFSSSTADWRDLLRNDEIDIISITSPNEFHAEMAIAAMEAGKHVWCEKPMAPSEADAELMLEAARKSGRVALLGYNYIQNPAIRFIRKFLEDGAIGTPYQTRIEMDEDFMADPDTPFFWKHARTSGYGALDDFAVHPLSLIRTLFGGISEVFCAMGKPYADRRTGDGSRRAVETYDFATMLMRLENGMQGTIEVNRSAWGRKGRIFLQIFGSKGMIVYDQERMNEVEVYQATGPANEQGFKKVLMSPHHPPYEKFVPAPGHQLGFNDLKIIECRELLKLVNGEPANAITFEDGLQIEKTIHAAARAFEAGHWKKVD